MRSSFRRKVKLVFAFRRELDDLIDDSSSHCACVVEKLSGDPHKNFLVETGLNSISWADSLEWAENYRPTHVQIILAPNQFFTYELTLANSLISMQNTRIPDNFAISKEIKKDFCDIIVKFDLFATI